jgi:hypothetical protein
MRLLLLICCFLVLTFGNIVNVQGDARMRGGETYAAVSHSRHKTLRGYKKDRSQLNIRKPRQKKNRGKMKEMFKDLTSKKETTQLILSHLQNSIAENSTNQISDYTPSLKEYANDTASFLQDMKLIKNISLLTNPSNETRVISFGLFGSRPKYNLGAIYNAEMVKVYFPGWKCRFYVADDVLNLTISVLKDLGADIEYIPPGMGKMSGMFWRFMVADDPTVDRYIIRDVDSRLNSRDR